MAEPQSTNPPRRRQPLKSQSFWPFVFVAVLILIGVIGIIIAQLLPLLQSMYGPRSHPGVGQSLTFLELTPLTGNPQPLSAADLQGRVTLLNFWGTWCPPCRAELPHMNDLNRRFADQGNFQLVAISYPPGGQGGDLKTLREQTAALLKKSDLDLPTYCDPDSKTLAAVDRVIGFQGFPTSLLLDRQGVIRAVWVGYQPGTEAEIEDHIEKELAKANEKRK
jgi:thiol-disulfide isomerase/thioredoxin